MYYMSKSELKKIFIEWFTGGYYLDEKTSSIKMDKYLSPEKSSHYYKDVNMKNIFPIINVEVLPCLGSNEDIVRIKPIEFLNYNNYLSVIYWGSKGNVRLSIDGKEPSSYRLDAYLKWKESQYLTIIQDGFDYGIILTSHSNSNYSDTKFTVSKNELNNAVLKKFKELYKVKKDLDLYIEKSNGSKQHFSQSIRKNGFYFKDILNDGRIKKIIFTEDGLNKIKELKLTKLNSQSCPYKFQEKLARILGINVDKENRSISIDNGYGSYTYTFMCYSINYTELNEEHKNIVNYAYNRFKNISIQPKERYIKINKGMLGFVQNTGGYTYVS